MLAHLRRRWPNITSALGQCIVLSGISSRQIDRQTDRYFIDKEKIITDLFVIEMKEIYVHVYTRLLIC